MKRRRVLIAGMIVVGAALPAAALASGGGEHTPTLVEQVQDATRDFRDVDAAMAAGYASAGSCVSGPEEGAMGIHYANGDLVGDGALAADQPELLVYELRNNRLRLLGVEYLVLVDDWVAAGNTAPPVLVGQQFHLVNSPNRYGLPAFYELHVWAWRDNPHGTFVDWNPNVSCVEYTGEHAASGH
jgi:hypothetical protein